MCSCPSAAPGEFIGFGFQGAVGTDAKIVIGQEAIDLGDIIGKQGIPPFQFKPFDLFVGVLVMGKKGTPLDCGRREQY